MNCKIIDIIKGEFNDILEIKEMRKFEKFISKYTPEVECSTEFKEILFLETEKCLEIFNKFIIDIINNYVNNKITFEELESYVDCTFTCKNNEKKQYFTKIFPEFIKLLINNKGLLDEDKKIIHKPKNPKSYDSDIDDIISDNEEDKGTEYNEEEKIISNYPKLRKNQIIGLENTIKQNFDTGCHIQVMGSGKTILELATIDINYKYFTTKKKEEPVVYIFVSSKLKILENAFFNNKKKEEYKIHNINLDEYNIIDLVKGDIKNIKISNDKPNIMVINTQYLIQSLQHNNFKKNIGNIKLIIFDECHNISAPRTFKFMEQMKNKNINIIGFSATPTRTHKKSKEKFKKIFSKNDKINVISTYDLFEGIVDNCILPLNIQQYEFKGVYEEASDDSDYSDTIEDQEVVEEDENSNKKLKIKYSASDIEYNKKILKKILIEEMKTSPYVKFVAWCSSIKNLMMWKQYIKKEIPDIKVYVTHSGNDEYEAVDEYDAFYELKPKNGNKINAILLNVNIVSEGCDIEYVDTGLFLDPVKKRDIVRFFQNAGRICRTDKLNKKKHAKIIYTFIKDDNKDIAERIIEYFEMILQLVERNDDYYEKIKELFKNLKTNNREVRILLDNKKDHDCVLYLEEEVKDWEKIRNKIGDIIRQKPINIIKPKYYLN